MLGLDTISSIHAFKPAVHAPDCTTFGGVVKHARIEQGLTQDELAATVGVDRVTISRIENDHPHQRAPRTDVVRKVCETLKIDYAAHRDNYMEFLQDVPGVIKAILIRRRISQRALAEALGVSTSLVSAWVSGSVRPSRVFYERLMQGIK